MFYIDLTVLETQSNPYALSDSFSPGGYGKLDKEVEVMMLIIYH